MKIICAVRKSLQITRTFVGNLEVGKLQRIRMLYKDMENIRN